ncbi:carotenoid oxygenase [Delitschia confertaspora ATCC 74209]|uniref:Carotenoid oxygenase n=1 Tax=Delitschia confertaspora ATCC 74209 TaxID=1513339 RepID=A0A9P4JGI7_9PLEO|nr:carotenoid oxygenase [Delitschia confertaspora ATCC 74209]
MFRAIRWEKPKEKHPYLTGNFAPIARICTPTPCTYTGVIPEDLYGGEYVRNGANPIPNLTSGRDAYWLDGDGMLSGVIFQRSLVDPTKIVPHFVNRFILTDLYLYSLENPSLQGPILPSIAILVNPLSSLMAIVLRILRTILIVFLSHLPGSEQGIKKISVANNALVFHDGRALSTCESGPPIRIKLPGLETIGWYDGDSAEGECHRRTKGPIIGGNDLFGWIREWTTGHPKVDPSTGEMMLFHSSFLPPYVQYSVIPQSYTQKRSISSPEMLNIPIPGVSGAKMMHDFGVSKNYTVILDLPLSLDPLNLIKRKPIILYEPDKPARFGVFPRRELQDVKWFETKGCCIFHTANTWDELDSEGNVTVNLLACRLTSPTVIYTVGNIAAPQLLSTRKSDIPLEKSRHDSLDADKSEQAFSSPSKQSSEEEDQCRLYLYQFNLECDPPVIKTQYALSSIPFEFPTLNPAYEMSSARYIYGCSTTSISFDTTLGRTTKIDVIAKIDIHALIEKGKRAPPTSITGCIDTRTVAKIRTSRDPKDSIKTFIMPPNWYAQEARFIPRKNSQSHCHSTYQPRNPSISTVLSDELEVQPDIPQAPDYPLNPPAEDDGYLIFYAFDESQLDEEGECPDGAVSELWIVDAKGMRDVVARVRLPQRVPYGLHGRWFTEEEIRGQRGFERVREVRMSSQGKVGLVVGLMRMVMGGVRRWVFWAIG